MKYSFYLLLFLLASCTEIVTIPTEPVMGIAPIYNTNPVGEIKSEAARDIGNLGKIVYKVPFIFVNERFKGIHVIDNLDPKNPKPAVFWNIPGLIDFTIKENFLYAENGNDLITIDISNIDEIRILSLLENINSNDNNLYPPDYTGWFECVDENLGVVLRWEQKELTNPQCWK